MFTLELLADVPIANAIDVQILIREYVNDVVFLYVCLEIATSQQR